MKLPPKGPRKLTGEQYEEHAPEDMNLRLVESIEKNAKHYLEVFSRAVDKIMPKESKHIS